MKNRILRPEYLAPAACAVILILTLMLRPITGVADNGDFPRVMGPTGLQYMSSDYNDRYFGYVNRSYMISAGVPAGGGYFTTEIPIVLTAVVISQIANNTWTFDIRYLSLIYSLIFVFSIFLIVSSVRKRATSDVSASMRKSAASGVTDSIQERSVSGISDSMRERSVSDESDSVQIRAAGGIALSAQSLAAGCPKQKIPDAAVWLCAVLAVLIFTDIGYISYFNSLYGEAVSYVFLLLAAGAGLYLTACEKPRLWALICFFAGAFLFTGAKLQNCPLGLLAALFGIRLLRLGKGKAWRRTIFISTAAIVAVSLISYISVSKDIKVCNKYQSVFYGILKGSPDPAGDLVELGLDPGFAVLAGTNYFMKYYPLDIKNPAFRDELYEKVSPLKTALFYLRHPARFLGKLGTAAENGFKLKQGFGNYEKYDGIKYGQTTNSFALWSDFKIRALPHSLLFVALFYLVFFLVSALEYARRRKTADRLLIELVALIGIIGAVQLAVPVIGDGEADLSKHLFLFNVCFDMMFTIGIIYIADVICRAWAPVWKLTSKRRVKRMAQGQ